MPVIIRDGEMNSGRRTYGSGFMLNHSYERTRKMYRNGLLSSVSLAKKALKRSGEKFVTRMRKKGSQGIRRVVQLAGNKKTLAKMAKLVK